MSKIDWKKRFFMNSVSGLVCTGLSLVLALVMFRTLFGKLSDAEYGFWALMWAVMSMGFVLDMGIGLSVQKAIAERSGSNDLAGMNRLLATAFWGFVVIGVVAFAVMFLLRGPFLALIKTPPEYIPEFEKAFIIFSVAIAFTLPLALFSEVLHGIQRIDMTNWILIGSMVCNFAMIMTGLHLDWDFSAIVAIGAGFTVLPNIFFALAALRLIPGLSVHPKHFSPSDIREQIGFSLRTYFITASNKVLEQSDRLIIGAALGVVFMRNYQAALKVAEILRQFATQLGAVVSPAAANLQGDKRGLTELLLRASKFNFLLVTPVYVLAAVYLRPLLGALTGLETIPDEMWILGHLLLFSVYNSQIASICASKVLMMSGHERVLLKFSIVQTVTNVALSLMLVLPYKSVGVAIATLICSSLFGWGLVLPKILRTLELRFSRFAKFHLSGSLPPLAAFGIVLAVLLAVFPLSDDAGIFGLCVRGSIAMIAALSAGLPTLRSTWKTAPV